ncbi:MAG TPA: ATP-binding protein [Myxococcota bacterium]|nr:ATP-binding protein [Myxococcota bacterium]
MQRSPSIGMRWALRNALVFAIVLFCIATFAHFEVRRRVTKDAQLLLELEVRELVEELGTGALSASEIAEEVDPEIAAAPDPNLELGVQVFDDRGERIYTRGRLASLDVGVPRELAAAGSASVFSVIEIPHGAPYWVVSAKSKVGYVQVGVSSRHFVESAGQLGQILVASAPVLALLAGAIGWWTARNSLGPIRAMVRATRRIGFARLSAARIPTSGNGDELDLLAATLNDAFARVEEGASKLRQFTADAAHELRTPLTRLSSRLELTLGDAAASREDLWVSLHQTLEELRALSDALTATLLLAESDAGLRPDQREPVALRGLLQDLVDFYEPMASEQSVKLRFDAAAEVEVAGMAAWLRQAFGNLLRNALAHARATVAVRMKAPRNGNVEVEIEDDGRGIAPDETPRVFDRFYRARGESRGSGSGLGLAIALQIVKAHGGGIAVESRLDEGTIFRLTLPCADSA